MNLRFFAFLFQLVPSALLVSAPALAQPAPEPAPDDEDLEVPAAPGAGAPDAPPKNTVPGPAPSPAPAETESTPNAAEPPVNEAEIAPPATEPTPSAEPAKKAAAETRPEASPEPKLTNLERVAYARPVPKDLTIGGYIQAQYEHSNLSEDQLQPGGTPLNSDRFLVRRARLRLDRGWEYAAGTLELEANTVSGVQVGIRRAEGSLLYRGKDPNNLLPLVQLTAGVTDLPFGYELAESSRVRAFMERSLASSALFPTEMDVGVKLSGAIDFVRYDVSVSNGEPVTDGGLPKDPNAAKDITGRAGLDLDLAAEFGLAGGASFAVGKGFHAGTPATKGSLVWRDQDEDRVVDAGELFGLPDVAETPSENFDRWAFGLDLGFRLKTPIGRTHLYGEVYVAQNYDRGFLESDPIVSGVDVRQAGGYAAVVQDITEYGFVGFRYSVYDPNSDLIEGRADEFYPKEQTIRTYSLLAGAQLRDRARLSFQYDFIDDYLGRDRQGVPSDTDNDQWTLRLQVDL